MANPSPSGRHRALSLLALIGTLLVVAVCLRLAWWQLDRAGEKRQWLAEQRTRGQQAAADLPALLAM